MTKLTAEKGEILQSVKNETKDLQVEKEKIQLPLTELKQRIDKINLSVSRWLCYYARLCYFYALFIAQKGRRKFQNVR